MSNNSNPFMDYQKQFLEMWNARLAYFPGMDIYKKSLENAMPDVSSYWKTFTSPIPGLDQYWKSLAGMMPDMNHFMSAWPYKIPGLDNYTKVFDLWKSMGDPAQFAMDYQEKYMDLIQDLFRGLLPEGAFSYMQRPMDLMNTLVGYYNQNFAPLMEINENTLQRIMAGDLTAYTDFFHEFNEKYEETIGKYYNVMGLGLNRESNEDLMKAMSNYNKAMFATGELMSLVMNTGAESAKKLGEAFQNAVASGKAPTTFRDFYDLWSSTTEKELMKLLETDEFSKTFDYFSDMYSQYISALNKVYERMLASLPIPTNTDMKSLYKTVYDLRKDVRDLKTELAELKEQK